MSLLKRLFGGSEPKGPESIEYNGFRITPEPIKEAQGYRICALIEKEIGSEMKSHRLIRADTISDPEQAAEASVGKARQMIDQMGDALF